MSIITNFGCHGKCPYCIVRENGIDVPETTVEGLDSLLEKIKENGCNIVSVSGGGDPLHRYSEHKDYYKALMNKLSKENIPLEIHTSYIGSGFEVDKCKRVVYHLRDTKQLDNIERFGNEIVRVVFVVTEDMTLQTLFDIARYAELSKEIDELSFRQMVDSNYEVTHYLYNELRFGHEHGLWHYIEQNDYNLYYVNGKVYEKFSEIHK